MAHPLATAVHALISKQWVIDRASKQNLMRSFRFKTEIDLMLGLAEALQSLPSPSISKYPVPIIGMERESGDLLIGANLEFAGAPLGATVHAEQFLFARAFHRGTSIACFALAEPAPCGHCRQFILEFADGKNIRVQNARGLNTSIGELMPHGFGPEQLGTKGIRSGETQYHLRFKIKKKLGRLPLAALTAATRAYCPYSQTPSGVALQTKSGEIFSGAYIENAAFNPSLSPLHSALIDLVANGRKYREIHSAVLVGRPGSIDQSAATKTLLKLIAPKARLLVLDAANE